MRRGVLGIESVLVRLPAVYLKSLTLRGFKSFASSTTLRFEPGITCVVGPNGSGKSNVVDALAWVLGEQGAKSLRGGRMEDVIFAGTAGRPPLGRAEVVLTIDNADGALPVEFSEVTIARTMFRGGGSEYALNGRTCRLLDVQELLSDSGIGREMHVIVGQGRLDSVLQATPEDRRGFIEEAAGVLKHRKRKEKALRKLDATAANFTRVQDLLGEIRRQLKPLGRQAEVARRAATVQADLRDARARLLADDLVTARGVLERARGEEAGARSDRERTEASLLTARQDEAGAVAALAEDAHRLARAQETWYRLSSLRERITGTARLAAERLRSAAEDEMPAGDARDPAALAEEARQIRAQQTRIEEAAHGYRERLEHSVAARQRAEQAHAEEDRRLTGRARAAADRREGLARLHGRLQALRGRARAAADEIGRLEASRTAVLERAAVAEREFTALENQVAGLDSGETGLDSRYEVATAQLGDLEDRLAKARDESQAADRERAALRARTEALELGRTRRDGSGALLGAAEQVRGVVGTLAGQLRVRAGYDAAIAAALGPVADAVVVGDVRAAIDAMRLLRHDDLGHAQLVLGDAPVDQHSSATTCPAGSIAALELVEASDAARAVLSGLLAHVVVVEDLDRARAVIAERPDLAAVTRAGDLLGVRRAAGGSGATPSLVELEAASADTMRRLAEVTRDGERLRFEVAGLEEDWAQARGRVDAALAELHESDAAMAALAEQLAHLGTVARSARAEAERITGAIADAAAARDRDVAGLADLEDRVALAEADPDDEDDGTELARRGDAAGAARAAETEARLAQRTAEERAQALSDRADVLERAVRTEQEVRSAAQARRAQRRRQGAVAAEVAGAAARTLARLDVSLRAAGEQRARVDQDRTERETQLGQLRARVRGLETELARLTDAVHAEEIQRAEHQLRLEALEQRAIDELGLEADTLAADYGPEVPVPAVNADSEPAAYDRDEQVRRLRSAERALALLGTVNPLALEEFAALEERHQFLTEQLEDVRRTRADLMGLVADVDATVQRAFADAYADVAREFEQVFNRLFPGGEGRLRLSDPDDMLGSGVDVEARPPGKRVKRLSLLSGGERALVAVTFLVALFKALPSPFYILDEVEAALDDTNLGRLLEIYDELRADSQLLVVTHQKRTMQVGDVLYGVSMRGDGESVVVSQRLREAS